MKLRFAQNAAAALACFGLLVPHNAFAASVAPSTTQGDIALRDGGLLVGQVVDAQGKPLAEAAVSVRLGHNEIVITTTDKNGVFAAKGLRGGEYQVVTGGGQVAYRLWAPQTAPPAASNGALIVTGHDVVNGQCQCPPSAPCGCDNGGGLVGWVKNHPMLVAAGIAAAIAIPVAVADDDDPTS
ncbi:MAG: carboxypeptidase-like regulatory domain-containing protein [Planctomycetota bacterium]